MNFYQQPYTLPYPQGMYQQPVYPQFVYADQLVNPNDPLNQLPTQQQSYIENILRMNYGKVATVYMNFETRYLLLTIYLCYVTFDEKIEYEYPFRNK